MFTSVKLLVKPPLNNACAMEPPSVPTFARTGNVVSAGPFARSPNTLIRPPVGVWNSTVPRWPAVTG